MTREQLIECMARGAFLDNHPGENWAMVGSFTRDLYARNANAAYDALTTAGMVVVPREPTGEMLEAGRKAWKKPRLHVNYNPADELMTCGVIYRAMTEAANG